MPSEKECLCTDRLLQQRLAHISASTSAPSAVLDEDVGVGSQSASSFGRDVEIREVNLPAICWHKHRTDNKPLPLQNGKSVAC